MREVAVAVLQTLSWVLSTPEHLYPRCGSSLLTDDDTVSGFGCLTFTAYMLSLSAAALAALDPHVIRIVEDEATVLCFVAQVVCIVDEEHTVPCPHCEKNA